MSGKLDLPSTPNAVAALEHAREKLPAVVFNHSVRSYLYGRSLGSRQGLIAGRDYDDELLFLSSVLHDLGVSEDGPTSAERFEVHGADLAAEFARTLGVDDAKLNILWDAVALHTSVGIANRKAPEVALSHLGISADIIGFGKQDLPDDLIAASIDAYPRENLGFALTDIIAGHAALRPTKAIPMTFAGHVDDLYSDRAARTWFDVLSASGWDDQPTHTRFQEGAATAEDLASEFMRRLADRDVDGLAMLYAPDAVFVPQPGTVLHGRSQVREALAELVGQRANIALTLRSVRANEMHALISNFAFVTTEGAKFETVTTEVAVKRPDGRWFYAFDDPFFSAE
ncbi:SgcJ/EcaC family oxidoreductase [Agromyces sp. Soil535]|uniref:SgcJ/EcaC family oxidoreductase n=1 Tax=Agromyces sp. Soil535 TaxID=1736390 RepID=UPI00070223C4|nr:SgcJ/EcaC family oxidoreductase [Agromyces sp. Soil535]KRE24993.1 hypothetical protein ASG80_22155 [Agromyces sp. Soil535]